MWFRRKKVSIGLHLAEVLVVVLVPVVVVLGSVRLLMNEWWVNYEYSKSSFPKDVYGFSGEDRLEFGAEGLRYVVGREELESLGEREFAGEALYSERELGHMEDVRGLVTLVRRVFKVAVLTLIGLVVWLYRKDFKKMEVEDYLVMGGMITLNFMVIVVVMVTLNWDWVFGWFHGMFFEDGSWLFYETDTLIRLYPERFWVDSVAAVLGVSSVAAGVLSMLPLGERLYRKRKGRLRRLIERLVKRLRGVRG